MISARSALEKELDAAARDCQEKERQLETARANMAQLIQARETEAAVAAAAARDAADQLEATRAELATATAAARAAAEDTRLALCAAEGRAAKAADEVAQLQASMQQVRA